MRRKTLSCIEQFELLRKVKDGVPKETIVQDYDICTSTYYRIIERKSEILKNTNNFETNRKFSKATSAKLLDDAVIKWYLQERDRGSTLSMAIIQQKALTFGKMLDIPLHKFKASNGWFQSFKRRHCITNIQIKDEVVSNDFGAEKFFYCVLNQKIAVENLSTENVYNADETGIFWRTSPFSQQCTMEMKYQETKHLNSHITALFCSNFNGSHRIPPLIIGDSEMYGYLEDFFTGHSKDKRLKYNENVNIIYADQNKSYMDSELFMLWYTDIFIPHVLAHHNSRGKTGKVLLILDNAPCHPDVKDLNSVHQNFEVIYLPRNVSPKIQPMEQGLISTTKILYKKNLLQSLLNYKKIPSSDEFFNHLNFQDCLDLLSRAWYGIDSISHEKYWKSLLGDPSFNAENFTFKRNSNEDFIKSSETSNDNFFKFPTEVWNQLIQLSPQLEYSKELFIKWFEKHYSDCGWEALSDVGIIDFVTIKKKKLVINNTEFVEISDNPEGNENNCGTIEAITSSDAFEDIITFDDCLKMECAKSDNEENENTVEAEKAESVRSEIEENVGSKIIESTVKSEIEIIDNIVESTDSQQVTSSNVLRDDETNEIRELQEVSSTEAHLGLMTFRRWMEASGRTSKKYYRYIDQLENLITK
ncbi:jerky protein homolog-like [Leptopilina heterotoma]|uniref:jerky protein homolog-like n=1 Tax=Leptopilina heterotoma TaxID=63436 RepID=UPI001CA7DED0|nr:jerky protein homolog-like [Leptopilina heterotoma]